MIFKMNFKKAYKKLNKIANGKYFKIYYDVGTHSTGNINITCTVYIDGYNLHSGCTWKEAFNELRKEMNPIKHTEKDIEK